MCLICKNFYFQKSHTVKCYNSSESQTVESDVKHVSSTGQPQLLVYYIHLL